MERFLNRSDAGKQLAALLRHLTGSNPVVLGLARGGIEVAAEIAEVLDAPLEVLIARKLGAPCNPEYGIGAVAPGEIIVVDEEAVRALGLSAAEVDSIAAREMAEVDRRLSAYGACPLDLQGKCAILVDDGLATGITALAAVRYLRSLNPARLVLAVPVASIEGSGLLRPEVDELVTIGTPPHFSAVGQWYEDFTQTTDQQVQALLLVREDHW